MARSHHRKKHKAHLQNFKHSHDTSVSKTAKSRSSGKWVFMLVGAVAGFVVSYFVTDGSMLWMVITTLAGGVAGYLFGNRIDNQKGR